MAKYMNDTGGFRRIDGPAAIRQFRENLERLRVDHHVGVAEGMRVFSEACDQFSLDSTTTRSTNIQEQDNG